MGGDGGAPQQRAKSVRSSACASFEVPERYQYLKSLGSGSYGQVGAFHDSKHSRDIAIKRVRHVLDNFLVSRRTLREIRLMRHFRHPNLMRLLKVLPLEANGDLYMCLELMDCDLDTLVHAKHIKLSDRQCRRFCAQVLLGLMNLHGGHVIHRDLKPANIFVRLADCQVKIGDLGLSRGIAVCSETGEAVHPNQEHLTEYVVTRWYRGPEVLLARSKYGPPVDVWSVGCILYEMWTAHALFPGKNSYDQLKRIFAVMGVPPSEDLAWVPQESMSLLNRCAQPAERSVGTLGDALSKAEVHPEGVDILHQMCLFDPNRRATIEQALDHSYLRNWNTEQDRVFARNVVPVDNSFDSVFDGIRREGEPEALLQLGRLLKRECARDNPQPSRPQLAQPVASDSGASPRWRTPRRTGSQIQVVPEAEKTQHSARPSLTAGRLSAALGTAPVAVQSEQLPSARDKPSLHNAGSLYDSMAMRYQSQRDRAGSQQDMWGSSAQTSAKEENKLESASAELTSAAAASLAEYKQKLLGRNSSLTDVREGSQQSSRVSARYPPSSMTAGAVDSLRAKWAVPRGETRPESGSQCSTRESSSATLITPTSATAAPLTSRRSAELPAPSLIGSARQDGGDASNTINLDDLAAAHVDKIGQDIDRRPWAREVASDSKKTSSLQTSSYYPGTERDAATDPPPLPHLLRQRSRHAEYQDERSMKPGSLLGRRSGNEGEYEASKLIDRPLGERMRLQQHRTHREALVEGRDTAREYNSNKPTWLSDALPSRSRRDGLVEDLGAPQKLSTTSTTARTREQDAERSGISTSRSLTRLRDPVSARASSQTLHESSNHRSRAYTSRPTEEGELEFAKSESYSSRQNVHVGHAGVQRSALLTSAVTHSNLRSQPQSARTAAVERSTSRSALGSARPDQVMAGELPPPQKAPPEVSAPSPRLFMNSQKKFLQDLAEAEQHWKNLQSTFNEALGLGTTSTAQPAAVPAGGSWSASAGGGRRW